MSEIDTFVPIDAEQWADACRFVFQTDRDKAEEMLAEGEALWPGHRAWKTFRWRAWGSV